MSTLLYGVNPLHSCIQFVCTSCVASIYFFILFNWQKKRDHISQKNMVKETWSHQSSGKRNVITSVKSLVTYTGCQSRNESCFKLLLIVYKSLNHAAPKYLSELLRPYHPKPNLRSSTRSLLVVPNSRLKSFGDRAFEIAGPKLWNTLPMNILAASTTHQFKSLLKIYLFTLDFWTFHNVIVLLNCFYHFLAYCRFFQKSCGLVCNFYGFWSRV